MEIEYFKHKILPLKDKLFRKALSITESVAESQDIVQEVMMRLWDKRAEWATIANMELYSMVLAKNLALDKIKRSGYFEGSIDMDAARQLSSDAYLPHEMMEKEESIALLWKVIRLLPEKQQQLIRLREIEELSYQRIAQEMNMTEVQVKATLFRARQKMKEMYLNINNHGEY